MKQITNKWTLAIMSLIFATFIFFACSKKGSSIAPPTPINGYNNSSEIAPSNLIGYWPFDGNYNETKNNMVGTNSGGSFTTGIKGQAYMGSGSSYVLYKNINSAFSNLQSFTLSVWLKVASQPVNNTTPSYIAGQGAQGVFFMTDDSSAWNLLHLDFEPYMPVSGDSLRIHAGFNNTGAPAYQGIVPEGFLDSALQKWVQVAMTYDASTSTYTLYQNAVSVAVQTAWDKIAGGSKIWTDGTKTTPMGNITFKNPATNIVIGAFPQAVSPSLTSAGGIQPWSGNLQGAIDELRVYNKALSQSDISALYQLELAGR